jgi:hypothetical protein
MQMVLFYIFLHLHRMKKLIISLSLAVTVLFSILFQSLHTYGHFVKAFFQTECHHKHNGTTAQITHKHFDTCKVCHFTFGSYVVKVLAYTHFKLQSSFKTARAIVSFQVVCIPFEVHH